MGCRSTFSFTETVLGETPLDDAVYVPSVNKIFGTIGPHIARFNATTGAYETSVRVVGPAMGTCRICYHSPLDTIFVSVWNVLSRQWLNIGIADWAIRGLYPVNPSTLAIGAVLDINSFTTGDNEWPIGPRHVFSAGGTYLYFAHYEGDNNAPTEIWRVNPLNLADNFWPSASGGVTGSGDAGYNQFATDGSNIYAANPTELAIQRWDLALTNGSNTNCNIVPPEESVDNPVSVAWSTVNSRCYAVCGTAKMLRVNAFGGTNYSVLNLAGVAGTTSPNPVRIRYNAADSMLYLPCQNDNGIIVWDPSGETGVFKSGFDLPIDVVFTGTKAFAVQHGITGLKEVT